MLYFIGLLLPPVAVIACGKPFQAFLNLPLTLLGWVPGVLHAWAVVAAYQDKPGNVVIKMERRSSSALVPILLLLAIGGFGLFFVMHPEIAAEALQMTKTFAANLTYQANKLLHSTSH